MKSVLFFLLLPLIFSSQTILVGPYLQDAQPNSIRIMWETSIGQESIVEYGTNTSLLNSVSGTSVLGYAVSQVHDTKIVGLQPDTRYYYRVKTLSAQSSIYNFITPPLPEAEKSFNIVSMSDMQQDSQHPNVFDEIINQQLIPFVNNRYGNDLPTDLAYVFIPGDLVTSGNNYFSWKSSFFDPAKELFAHVPVYPVAGNHEDDSPNYFRYFHLPENGTNTSNYIEHWWYKDYSNVRLIGLESNSGYRVQQQLDWLQGVLDDAAMDTTIDFVFAQLHHPYKSELWIAGNTDYTGDIIPLLENFSTLTGKPSAHFFGHTHGYSRGQSKEHNHLMVNVATAGGAIDNWGEYAQQDYEEFSKSDDDYGFVLLEVQAGSSPQFLLTRVSHGSYENGLLNNVITDTVRIKKYNNAPIKPTGVFPSNGELLNPKCILFLGSLFVDPDGDLHGATQWQISEDSTFSSLVYDDWYQYENWFFDQNLLAGNNMIDHEIKGLDENKTYYWRVRYRDRSLYWSEWSETSLFQTSASTLSPNLLVNSGAEDGTSSWTETAGSFESILSGECSGNNAFSGSKLFAVGGVCDGNAYAQGHQEVDVSSYQLQIDNDSASVLFGGYLSDFNGNDMPSLKLEYYNSNGTIISTSQTFSNQTPNWTLIDNEELIPVGTRSIKMILMGTRNSGVDNDSYFDDLFLKLDLFGLGCEQLILNSYELNEKPISLTVYPNPFNDEVFFEWKNTKKEPWVLEIIDAKGAVLCVQKSNKNTILIKTEELFPGQYFYKFYIANQLFKIGKISHR